MGFWFPFINDVYKLAPLTPLLGCQPLLVATPFTLTHAGCPVSC